ncbi:MAG: CBS domain-containing protein [Chloroflexi bacterium]|nr:CBS domain-containing protein [Chloroflexota bacterium]
MTGGGFRIGRILGINVHVDWSWLFIFALVTWNLSTAFGQFHPAWSLGLRWGIALVASLLFFASVLAHELAHSLTARAQGTPVRRITLFLFGGVSNIQREPESPGQEFTMAILGPVTSLVIGAALTLLVSWLAAPAPAAARDAVGVIRSLGPVGTVALWLGSVNIILGIFNLIPGFPLDGGRVLRSIIWKATGSLQIATRWASWVGQAIAWVMIFTGIAMVFGVQVPYLGGGLVSGLWLAFIGWFLSNAASQSYRQLVIQDLLEDVCVSDIMRRNPRVIDATETVSTLVHEYVMGTDERSFPVLDGESLAGIVTLSDIRQADRNEWGSLTVRDIMTPRDELLVVAPDDDVGEALNVLTQHEFSQMPVMEQGRLVGLLRMRDIVRWLQIRSDGRESVRQDLA